MRLIALCALTGLLSTALQAQTHPTHPAHPVLKASPTRAPVKKPVKAATKAAPAPTAAAAAHHEPEVLDAERMAVAPRVLVGDCQCEHGKKVGVKAHPSLAGRFVLTHGRDEFTLTPQPTNTGVVRLENTQLGIVWLQVPIKSMLMDAKKGQRMADNCMHAEQLAEVEALTAPKTP